jgi:hypothetical protein
VTKDWDDHMLVLAADASLPLHFSHGVPALASREGHACAALADILLNGLSQERVRRLFSYAAAHSRGLAKLHRFASPSSTSPFFAGAQFSV